MRQCIVPAVFLAIANCTNSISLQLSGVMLTYVVKACIPVFTVLICCFVHGQQFAPAIYFSLLPICAGVIVATGTDLSFTVGGILAALISALSQTMMNLTSKQMRMTTGLDAVTAFFGMAMVATLFSLPFLLIADALLKTDSQLSAFALVTRSADELLAGDNWASFIMLASALAYYVEYALNFAFVGYVSSVTFAVCDIARRIAIILTGTVLFHKELTLLNWVGIVVALSGVLWYSHLENLAKHVSAPAVNLFSASVVTGAATKALRIFSDSPNSRVPLPLRRSPRKLSSPRKED